MNARASTETDSGGDSPDVVAVIDIGASSIRMAIAEIRAAGSVHILERLVQGVSLGKDTFDGRIIRKSTMESCVRVLRAYQKKLQEYRISGPERIRVVATSAVREATNRLAFIDRIYIATGLVVESVSEAEIARMTYLGIQPLLEREMGDKTTIITEVGGGTTDLLVLRGGDVVHSQTYRLGSLRLRETVGHFRTGRSRGRGIIESQVDRTVEEMRTHAGHPESAQLLVLGGDIRFAASQLAAEQVSDSIWQLGIAELSQFTEDLLTAGVDRIMQRYHLSLPDAESLGPALLVYVRMAEAFGADRLLITGFTLRDAVLNEMSSRQSRWSDEFVEQILRSSLDLGARYSIDLAHAQHVANLAQRLYRELADEHRLVEPRFELILRAAAIVHEVGLYVNPRGYHKHSYYLVNNSEIFGLSRRDLRLVALVARYHRRASPKPAHEGYAMLDRDRRIVVCKLAAILRVADALDHSRSQRISTLECEVRDGQLVVSAADVEDLSLEQLELRQKGALFEETYGLQVLLRRIGQ